MVRKFLLAGLLYLCGAAAGASAQAVSPCKVGFPCEYQVTPVFSVIGYYMGDKTTDLTGDNFLACGENEVWYKVTEPAKLIPRQSCGGPPPSFAKALEGSGLQFAYVSEAGVYVDADGDAAQGPKGVEASDLSVGQVVIFSAGAFYAPSDFQTVDAASADVWTNLESAGEES